MNPFLLTAAALALLIGVFHSVLGERYILIRLFRRPDLPKLFGGDWFTKRTLRFAWHLTSLAWWGFGAILLMAARPEAGLDESPVLAIVQWTFLVTAAVAFLASRGKHLSWIVFLAIGLLIWTA